MKRDIRSLYAALGIELAAVDEITAAAPCPFHADLGSSFRVLLKTGDFSCLDVTCGRRGDLAEFERSYLKLKNDTSFDKLHVLLAYDALQKDVQLLGRLEAEHGILASTVYDFKLGWKDDNYEGRWWIPISDAAGEIVNVRHEAISRQLPGYPRTIYWRPGAHGAHLFPIDAIGTKITGLDFFICEDELTTLLLNQHGLRSLTVSGGLHLWKAEWDRYLIDQHVCLLSSETVEGRRDAGRLAQRLVKVARSVRTIELPFYNKEFKTVADWFVREKHELQELVELVANTPLLAKPGEALEDGTVHHVDLERAGQRDMLGKNVEVPVITAGKDLAPYGVPHELTLTCNGGLRICQECPIAQNGGVWHAKLAVTSPHLISLLNVNQQQQKYALRVPLGIPICPRFEYKIDSYHAIEELKLIPDTDHTTTGQYVMRTAYHVGAPVRTNQAYVAKGRSLTHPASQYVTLLLTEMKPSRSTVESYKPDAGCQDRLAIFQPRELKDEELLDRWRDIAADLSANVTHIYRRDDLIFAMDLVFHSVLNFAFQEQTPERCWTEGLIVGDTRCGKSVTAKALVQHYGLGELMSCEKTSEAGLLGGMQQTQKRWAIQWGKIPLNDGKLLTLDEVSNLDKKIIAGLRAARSSGIAELAMIQTERTRARTRMLWLSNPRSNMPLNTHANGALVIRDLIGDPADIARFDFALLVAAADVPLDVINQRFQPKFQHRFTREMCHELLLWTWSRTKEQVVFKDAAIEACLDYTRDFAATFNDALPLVQGNEQRIKFARLAAAVAARFFSTEDGETLLVDGAHVQLVARLLHRWYTNTTFGYDEFSKRELQAQELTKEDEEIVKNLIYPLGVRICQRLLAHNYLKLIDFEDITGRDRAYAKSMLSTLVQCGALHRKSNGYRKSPAFIKVLRQARPEVVATYAPPPPEPTLTQQYLDEHQEDA